MTNNKNLPVLGTLALAGLTACAGGDKKQEASAPKKPMNILFIMCDDHS